MADKQEIETGKTQLNRRINTRSNSRLIAVQALYSAEFSEEKTDNPQQLAETILATFKENNADKIFSRAAKNIDKKFYRDIVAGTLNNLDKIDPVISESLAKEWNISKVSPMVKIILRLGGFELKFVEKVPAKVVIKEYLRIAEKFSGEKELKFINAVLDNMAKKIRI